MTTSPKIAFFTGKGGVGKTSIALSFAKYQQSLGKKVLFVEISDQSYLANLNENENLPYDPVTTSLGVDWAVWNPAESLKEYALQVLKFEKIYNLFFENKVMKSLIGVAPGLNELSILGKITSEHRGMNKKSGYDIIVIDSFSTGHFEPLIKAPQSMAKSINVGPMHSQSLSIHQVLANPEITSFYLVTTLEKLVLSEFKELFNLVQKEMGVTPKILTNKIHGFCLNEAVFYKGSETFQREFQWMVNELNRSNLNFQTVVFFLYKILSNFENSSKDFQITGIGIKVKVMQRLHIVLGLGGVGKTTLSCSLGYHLASLGKRTHILTIDPSKRLSSALGFQGELYKNAEKIQEGWAPISAQVISPKKVFIDFIEAHSSGSALKDKILESQLFNDLVNNLAGSQEFTSLETLYQVSQNSDFECIVLDTPPSQHTLDFFNAPKKFLKLFDSEVVKWFQDPEGSRVNFVQRMFQAGTKKALMGFSLLTGKAFIKELSLFFEAISNIRHKIVSRMEEIELFIKNNDVEYSLVLRPDLADIKSNKKLLSTFQEIGISIDRIYVNQTHPHWMKPMSTSSELLNEPLLQDYISFVENRKKLIEQEIRTWNLSLPVHYLSESNKGSEGNQVLLNIQKEIEGFKIW